MCQREILDFLKENKERKWFVTEICLFIPTTPIKACRALQQLRKYSEVNYKEITAGAFKHQKYLYWHKK